MSGWKLTVACPLVWWAQVTMEKFEGIGALARRGTSTLNVAPLPIRKMPLKVGAPMMHETCNTTPPTFHSPPTAAAERPISLTAFAKLDNLSPKDLATSSECKLLLFRRTSLSAQLGNTSQM